MLSGIALRQSEVSFEEFSGYADVSVLMKPAVRVGKRTELPPEMRYVSATFTLLSQALFCISTTENGLLLFRLTFRFKAHHKLDRKTPVGT